MAMFKFFSSSRRHPERGRPAGQSACKPGAKPTGGELGWVVAMKIKGQNKEGCKQTTFPNRRRQASRTKRLQHTNKTNKEGGKQTTFPNRRRCPDRGRPAGQSACKHGHNHTRGLL